MVGILNKFAKTVPMDLKSIHPREINTPGLLYQKPSRSWYTYIDIIKQKPCSKV